MKTSLVFLYRLLMIALLAWIAYTQTVIYRGWPAPVTRRPIPVTIVGGVEISNDPLTVEIDGQPVRVETDAWPLEVIIVR